MTQHDIIVAYNKAVKVVLSCRNVAQLHSAIRYKKNLEKVLPPSYLWISENLNTHIRFKLNVLRKRYI